LFCQTYAADVHLSEVMVEVTQALERAIGAKGIQVIVTELFAPIRVYSRRKSAK